MFWSSSSTVSSLWDIVVVLIFHAYLQEDLNLQQTFAPHLAAEESDLAVELVDDAFERARHMSEGMGAMMNCAMVDIDR